MPVLPTASVRACRAARSEEPMPVRHCGLSTVRVPSSSRGTAPVTTRIGSAPPALSRCTPRSARVWPLNSTSAFGWPNLEPSPAASRTPATVVRTVSKRTRPADAGDGAEDGGRRTEDGGRRTEGGGTEGRRDGGTEGRRGGGTEEAAVT